MKLTILGSSSALPTSERNPSAHVLSVHERFFLIDCGEGTQLQLRKFHIRFGRINNIFITHLHGDHVFGLYGLLSTFSLMGRKSPLNIYAPENYNSLLNSHLCDFDIHLGFEIIFHPLKGKDPQKIYEDKYLTVTSFPLKHRIPAFGFLFRENPSERKIIKDCIARFEIPVSQMTNIKKGKNLVLKDGSIIRNEEITLPPPDPLSFAYCSDTSYFSRLSSFFRNVDLLYCEATFGRDLQKLAKITGHSTTSDAARLAKEAEAGTLIIGHFSARYKDVTPLVNEAKEIFPGTYAATDGSTWDIRSGKPM